MAAFGQAVGTSIYCGLDEHAPLASLPSMTDQARLAARLRRLAMRRIDGFIASGDRSLLYHRADAFHLRNDDTDDHGRRSAAARWHLLVEDQGAWELLAAAFGPQLESLALEADLGPAHGGLVERAERALAIAIARYYVGWSVDITDDGNWLEEATGQSYMISTNTGRQAFWQLPLILDMAAEYLVHWTEPDLRLALEGSPLDYRQLKRDIRHQTRTAYQVVWAALGADRSMPPLKFQRRPGALGFYRDLDIAGPSLVINESDVAAMILQLGHRPFSDDPSRLDSCFIAAKRAASEVKAVGSPGGILLHEMLHALAAHQMGPWRENPETGELVVDWRQGFVSLTLRLEDLPGNEPTLEGGPNWVALAAGSPWADLNEGWTNARTLALLPDFPIFSSGALGLAGAAKSLAARPPSTLDSADHTYAAPAQIITALFTPAEIYTDLLDALEDPQLEILARLRSRLTPERMARLEVWADGRDCADPAEPGEEGSRLMEDGWGLVAQDLAGGGRPDVGLRAQWDEPALA